MGSIPLTHDEARAEFPVQVSEIMSKITGKAKGTNPDKYKWTIEWCERIECARLDVPVETYSGGIEDRVAKRASRCKATLSATYYRSWYAQLTGIPGRLMEVLRKSAEDDAAERERFARLSTEERQAEVSALMGRLSGPGFFVVLAPNTRQANRPGT